MGERLFRSDPDPGETCTQFLFGRMGRRIAQQEIEDSEEAKRRALVRRSERRHESNRRGGFRGGLAEIGGQRLDAEARLHLLHIPDIGRLEKLGTIKDKGKVGLRPDHPCDPGRRRPFPIRPGEQISARAIARRPRTDISEIMGVEIDELRDIIAPLLDLGHRQDERLGAQVGAQHRIGRVGVRRVDRPVLRRIDPRLVVDPVPVALIFRIALIDEIGVLDPIMIDERKAVDIGFFCDSPYLRGRYILRRGRRHQTRKTKQKKGQPGKKTAQHWGHRSSPQRHGKRDHLLVKRSRIAGSPPNLGRARNPRCGQVRRAEPLPRLPRTSRRNA